MNPSKFIDWESNQSYLALHWSSDFSSMPETREHTHAHLHMKQVYLEFTYPITSNICNIDLSLKKRYKK